MHREHSNDAQRLGVFLSLVLGLLFALVAALHWGWQPNVRGTTFTAPFLYPAAIIESVVAIALILAVVLPGTPNDRAGRAIGALILAVIGLFVLQIALMRGPSLITAGIEIFYGVAFVLALGCLALFGTSAYWRVRKT